MTGRAGALAQRQQQGASLSAAYGAGDPVSSGKENRAPSGGPPPKQRTLWGGPGQDRPSRLVPVGEHPKRRC